MIKIWVSTWPTDNNAFMQESLGQNPDWFGLSKLFSRNKNTGLNKNCSNISVQIGKRATG